MKKKYTHTCTHAHIQWRKFERNNHRMHTAPFTASNFCLYCWNEMYTQQRQKWIYTHTHNTSIFLGMCLCRAIVRWRDAKRAHCVQNEKNSEIRSRRMGQWRDTKKLNESTRQVSEWTSEPFSDSAFEISLSEHSKSLVCKMRAVAIVAGTSIHST